MTVADDALSNVELVLHDAEHRLKAALPNLDDMVIRAETVSPGQ